MLKQDDLNVNSLQHEFYLTFRNSVHVSQKTNCIYIMMTNLLMLFRELIHTYSENHTNHINMLGKMYDFVMLELRAGDMYNYHCDLMS
jgi:hypothetical protein